MQILQILSTLKISLDTDLTQHIDFEDIPGHRPNPTHGGVIDPEYTQYANEPRYPGVDLCKLLDVNTGSHAL